jgi:hypothetical protein
LRAAEVPQTEGFDLVRAAAYHGLFIWGFFVEISLMVNRRIVTALSVTVALAWSVALAAQKKDDKKQSDAQKKEIQDIVRVVDGVSAGQPAPNDLGLAWVREDFLKATGNKEYIPFTVSYDASKVTGSNVSLYWRVVAKDAPGSASAALPADAGKKDEKKDDKKAPAPRFAYEDLNTVTVTPGQSGPARVSRAFTVGGGVYDVYVVVKEAASQQKNAPAPKMSLIKQTVTVPDFWTPDLTTSSVIIAQRIEPLNAPLSQNEQIERPYALGMMEIVPAYDLKFNKKSELSTFMLIYNPKTDAMNKPDVTVEYNFYTKPSGAPEKFFNKTNPQALNATTLPPAFDMTLGHQLQTGQAVPLASFPDGDYRLEIKVTDKIANKSLTRDISFTVTAG